MLHDRGCIGKQVSPRSSSLRNLSGHLSLHGLSLLFLSQCRFIDVLELHFPDSIFGGVSPATDTGTMSVTNARDVRLSLVRNEAKNSPLFHLTCSLGWEDKLFHWSLLLRRVQEDFSQEKGARGV